MKRLIYILEQTVLKQVVKKKHIYIYMHVYRHTCKCKEKDRLPVGWETRFGWWKFDFMYYKII